MTNPGDGVEVHRAARRMHTRTDWLDSRHGFSFGAHYDPTNTHFGLLLAHNEDRVQPGTGYDPHPHRDMEIVTWVLSGSLVHRDSAGHSGIVRPGLAQRMSAGTGVVHSERNDASDTDVVHFVQTWVLPDTDGVVPGHEQRDVAAELDSGAPVVVASGMPKHASVRATTIAQRNAALHAVRLRPGASTTLPSAPFAHLFVPRGTAELEGVGGLSTADSARVRDADGQRLTAGPDGAEILVWEMATALG